MSAQSGTSRGSLRHVAVFGASGHTGRFVVAELLRRGFTPIPVGRDASRAPGFQDRGLEYRSANVEDPASLDRALAGAAAVINCAGPFLDTAEPLVAAALRARVHYLDVTAEQSSALATFERFAALARDAKIVVVPAMGFYGGLGDLLATAAGRLGVGRRDPYWDRSGQLAANVGDATYRAKEHGRTACSQGW
jgi:short subunit dehydrogenase-like uncharacterized protein